MQLLSIYIALFALLAGRVYSLNISIAGLGNVTATDFLKVPDTQLMTACSGSCSNATTTIAGCQDDNCLCTNATVAAIQTCEQCMFAALIAENRPMPDPRAGNQVALTNYVAACAANPINMTVSAQFATLALPDNWDGPFGQGLTPFTTAVYLIASLIIGGGAITVVNTM